MILSTERLYLRSLDSNDLDRLAEIYSNPDVMRFIGSGAAFSRSQTEKSIENWKTYEAKHGFANWAVIKKEGDVLIGKCGLSWLPDNSDVEISYLFDEPYWGMGYATEISKAVLEYGFEKCGLNRITAMAYPQNSPSIKVIEKLGMKFEKEAEFWGTKLLLFSVSKS